jgi:dethiobiotin synthetase
MQPPAGLFVTGTDTGVGKTRISAAIARQLFVSGRRVGVLKPAASGAEPDADGQPRWGDPEALGRSIGGGIPIERITPYLFEAPLAPPVAARLQGTTLDFAELAKVTRNAIAWWVEARAVDYLLMEGVGGWLCPLAEGATVADLARELDYPVLVVARRGLGTLNHTLLTVEAIRRRGVRLVGVILNGSEPTTHALAEETNTAELVRRLPVEVPLLAEVPFGNELGAGALSISGNDVDWSRRFAPPRVSWR